MAAEEALREFVTCTADDCDRPKIICRGCRTMNKEHCFEHSKDWRQEGVFYYHHRIVRRLPEGGWSKPHVCESVTCSQCYKGRPLRNSECWGRECQVKFDETKCLQCNPNAAVREYCVECYKIKTKEATCPNCNSVFKGMYICQLCDTKACKQCKPYREIDVSPMTLYSGPQLSVGMSWQVCQECTIGKTTRDIQNIARARNDEAARLRELERARKLVAEADAVGIKSAYKTDV